MVKTNSFATRIRRFLTIASVLSLLVVLIPVTTAHASSNAYTGQTVKKGTLTIGLEGTYAPYSYRKNGKLTGYEVDLGKALAKQMHLKAQFVPTKWDSLVAGLGSNKYDIVLNNLTVTPQRKQAYLFSKPYIYSQYVLITKAGNKNIKSLADVKGKKLAEGTGSDNAALAQKKGAQVVPSEEFSTDLSLIREGRVQGAINALPAWYAYKQSNSTKGLRALTISKSQQKPAEIAAMFNKQSPKLRDKTNQSLTTLRNNHQLKKMSVKYFGNDISAK